MNAPAAAILLAPTITKLKQNARGAMVVSGSHGGRYPGHVAAQAGVRAVIFNDAGIGKDEAGIGALPYLQALGIAAASVSYLSSRIGDAQDMMARGRISHANLAAQCAGVRPQQPCAQAAEHLRHAPHRVCVPAPLGESRTEWLPDGAMRGVVLIDSASLIQAGDAGRIIITGSHGGLVGGAPAMALQVDGFAAVFNDAGGGIDDAGLTRLPALDGRGIAALTVDAASARIGDARCALNSGIVSHANQYAHALGVRIGEPLAKVVLRWSQLPGDIARLP